VGIRRQVPDEEIYLCVAFREADDLSYDNDPVPQYRGIRWACGIKRIWISGSAG
jgi:hypothetical protein